MPKPTHIIVPIEHAQAIANYLARHPYAEVHQLVAMLQQAQPHTVEPAKADPYKVEGLKAAEERAS